jgi:glycosyltransferase involved in cell wall biosynthesis
MLLIDSLYINNSGGFQLLSYLTKELIRRGNTFFLFADARCQGRLEYCPQVEYMPATMKNRNRFYHDHKDEFSSVLCFGNIPTPLKLNVPVYTYFHNVNLLTLAEARTTKEKLTMWAKRQVFRHYKNNTDSWIVQTTNTAVELKRHLKEKDERIKIMPFYELPADLCKQNNEAHGDDYVYVSNYTGAKGHEELLEAWRILHQRGINKTLHLTVNNKQDVFLKKIQDAQSEGVRVVNHGFIPYEQVLELYRMSKAIVYPSHNESLGLGIIEAIVAGCDVIGSDLPFIHAVCKPSEVLNPYSSESIADAIEKYERGGSVRSDLLIKNMIDELIELITTSSENRN